MANTSRALRLLPAIPAPPPKPVYERVPLHGATTVDRREAWRQRYEAHQSETLRVAMQELSRTTNTTKAAKAAKGISK